MKKKNNKEVEKKAPPEKEKKQGGTPPSPAEEKIIGGERVRVVVSGCEVGGRWASEAIEVLRSLASMPVQQGCTGHAASAVMDWLAR